MDRKEAIEILEDFKVQDDWSQVYMPELHDAINCAIGALKEWTPISEELPKEYTVYENGFINGKPFKKPTSDTKSAVVLATIYGSVEKMFTRNGAWYFDSGAEGFPERAEDAPTAWMELPEPYRGE